MRPPIPQIASPAQRKLLGMRRSCTFPTEPPVRWCDEEITA